MAGFNKDTEITVLLRDRESEANCTTSYQSECGNDPSSQVEDEQGFSNVPNFIWIEVALLSNVFLSGFDGTVTASTYTTIGNEYGAANLASWITTSYLITSTAFQPLYGSISDVIGRRKCFLFASATFALGCIGCSIAPDIITFNLMRAITGVGGGGLITLSTIVNSDVISPRKRGLFQAFQNLLLGIGAVCGASFGGVIASLIGWRTCFISQVPFSLLSIFVGYKVVKDQPGFDKRSHFSGTSVLRKIDINGSITLVIALTCQLFVLTLGGNELNWLDFRLILLAIIGILFLIIFIYIECKTTANAIIPVKRFKSLFTVLLLAQNFFLGLSAYAYLFALPLLFQIALHDSPWKAGLRLALPSLATPIGGIITGILMNKYGYLKSLVYAGTFIMAVGNFIILLINSKTPAWIFNLLLMPANIGQGLAYPSSLFTFIFAYGAEHQATSTSTIYLSRSIGGIWGVSSVSTIIQAYLKYKVTDDLIGWGGLNGYEIKKIVKSIAKSTDIIYKLPDPAKAIVLMDYEKAIRLAQLFSSVCCAIAFILCVLRDITESKPDISVV